MNQDFWNERYGEADFAYGKQANDFLVAQDFPPASKILCLAEGEGRNAVHLAQQNHAVTCIDYSEAGIEKMKRLASEKGVELTTICADLSTVNLVANEWDAIVIIFGHFPTDLRQFVHKQVYNALKPGGKLVLEAYRKEQLEFKTGGPMNPGMLYSKEELATDFADFTTISIEEKQREVNEGPYHHGQAAVVQVVAVK